MSERATGDGSNRRGTIFDFIANNPKSADDAFTRVGCTQDRLRTGNDALMKVTNHSRYGPCRSNTVWRGTSHDIVGFEGEERPYVSYAIGSVQK